MIKENQRLLNQLNIASDGIIVLLAFLSSFFLRFVVLDSGINVISMEQFALIGLGLIPLHLITYQAMGLYGADRNRRLSQELTQLFYATVLDFFILLMALYVLKLVDVSRLMLGFFLCMELMLLGGKRIFLRKLLGYYRARGYNQKHVLVVGCGEMARRYQREISSTPQLGYQMMGYVAGEGGDWDAPYLGGYPQLAELLERFAPDEVVVALDVADYPHLVEGVSACEKAGVKVSILPFYAQHFSAPPQIDFIGSIPAVNLRRIPLENLANAVLKRCVDVCGALVLLVVTSPILLIAAIGVKLSSPGPILFAQTRVGLNKKEFQMYKFRSMRVNQTSDVSWSQNSDPRKTKFGAFIRKCSIDELPQFYNVLRGDMSLVGPRPELPHFVEQFKEEIPLYMVKHQVRPGITGWAQVSGYRGDTSILERIRHDIYYIEHWSLWLDIKILFLTLFRGAINNEQLSVSKTEEKTNGKANV